MTAPLTAERLDELERLADYVRRGGDHVDLCERCTPATILALVAAARERDELLAWKRNACAISGVLARAEAAEKERDDLRAKVADLSEDAWKYRDLCK